MIPALFKRFAQALHSSTKAFERSIPVAAAVGTIVFGIYGVLWIYVWPVEHENPWFRSSAIVVCLAIWSSSRWPTRYRAYLPWLWFLAVSYVLPFFSTYQLLASNYSILRSMLEVTTVFFVIVLFPHYSLAAVNMLMGIGFAALAAYLTMPDFWDLNHSVLKSVHIQAMVYTMVAGLIFTQSHLKGLLAREKLETIKALTGSIAHELRNPLSQLKYRLDSIGQRLPIPTASEPNPFVPAADLDAIFRELAKSKVAIERGMQVIEMTLAEIHAKPIHNTDLRYLSAASATRKAVEDFSYQSGSERERVSITVLQDFLFKGDETKYIFILFNLLKNAIFYFPLYPHAHVKITVDAHTVTVEDSGPGMKPEVLARAFESFHSEGKPGGTGLGLAFCKRTMRSFGGDIVCESVHRQFTRFTMHFPVIGAEEIAARERDLLRHARAAFEGKRILIVEDMSMLRATARAALAPLGAEIDEAEDGSVALEKLASQHYDAMLLDLSMPVMDGYATADKIRGGSVPGLEHITIVVHSAESPQVARGRLDRIGVDAFIPKGCAPLELIEGLYRAHTSSIHREKTLSDAAMLWGKTALIADDEAFNRRYLRAILQERGLQVIEADNGHTALALLQNTDEIDLVVTDISMPGLSGLEIGRAIRSLPEPRNTTPVIAMSAHSDQAMRLAAQEAGIEGFLVKPVDPVALLQKLIEQFTAHKPARFSSEPSPRPKPMKTENPAEDPILDTAKLDTLRQIGLTSGDLAQGLEDLRGKLERLSDLVRANNFVQAQELMHAFVGLAGQMGARALHEAARTIYVSTVETRQWPSNLAWLDHLRELFSQTERSMKSRLEG